MEHENNRLDDLVGKEPEKYQPNNQRNNDNGYTSLWYMYVSVGCMFTTLAITQDQPWMFAPAIGFNLAGVIDAGYNAYRNRQDRD